MIPVDDDLVMPPPYVRVMCSHCSQIQYIEIAVTSLGDLENFEFIRSECPQCHNEIFLGSFDTVFSYDGYLTAQRNGRTE